MRPSRIVRLILVIVALTLPSAASAGPRTDAARLRALFFQRDFETAVIEGTRAGAPTAKRTELKAWFVLNLARSGEDAQAIQLAEEMTRTKPDGWSWVALAGALTFAEERQDEAIKAAESAVRLMPREPDATWILAQTLSDHPKRRLDAIALVDRERKRIKNPAELLVCKASALYYLSTEPPDDDTKFAAALEVLQEARAGAPPSVSAWYLAGSYLNGKRRSDDAYPLLKRAVALAPRSTAVHRAYWSAVTGSRQLSADQKRLILEADVVPFLEENSTRPGALLAVSGIAVQMKWADRRATCEKSILEQFGDSREAEWVLVGRWRDAAATEGGSRSPEYRRLLTEFVGRPQHHHEGLLGEAYRELFELLASDASVPPEELYRIAQGALKYETSNPQIVWVDIPIKLAERRVHLEDAERVARDSIDVLRKRIESQRAYYRTAGEYERAIESLTSLGHDALGWVLFAEGKHDEAEKELLAAYELNHTNRQTLAHLGRFYVAREDRARAEDYLVQGLSAQGPGANPCEKALREVYETRRGSADGFDDYVATLKDTDRRTRREAILGTRLVTPEPVPAFTLKDLFGRPVSLDSLKGRIVVVNFWGIWCGWCVQELPAYQRLFEKYANDPQVAILTIDNDSNPDDVSPWMSQKKFTFPVLIDDQYVSKASLKAFPTTWFLDQQGRKVFEKVGWSQELEEEFGWRIEALRQ